MFLVRSMRHRAPFSRHSACGLLLPAIFNRCITRNENMNRFLPLALAKAPLSLAIIMCYAGSAWSEPVPGSLPAQWNVGAENCAASPQPPLQVHAYEPQTFILRQSPCVNPEANFLYLLIGSQKALLIDTGAVADPKKMPLAQTVLSLLPSRNGVRLPLIVLHSHQHRDHYAGDGQFASLPNVKFAGVAKQAVSNHSVNFVTLLLDFDF